MPCSQYFSQICAHGRPYMSSTSNWSTVPAARRASRSRRRGRSSDALREHVGLALFEIAYLHEVAHDADRLDERLGIVEHGLVAETRELAVRVAIRRVDLHGLHLARELEQAVRRPALDVRRPGDERVVVPEADRLAVPARHVGADARHDAFFVELPADVDVGEVVARRRAQDLHERRRHHDLMLLRAREVVAPHEAFGPAVLARPLRGVRIAFVVELLHQRV